ncbi:CPSF A subunit region protein [Babesia caballi]|uniref:CPSF A subunit region protein n=1 Tax=Babesia caballi TaxID=5871 RepID=A0AAV4M1M9_BABCB|nr:CPSF A subunit region protein [Babesia caballi]
MTRPACLAFATLSESTSADAILYGSFRYPGSHDVVIVSGRQLVLYALLSTPDDSSLPQDPYDKQDYRRVSKEDGERLFGRHVSSESVRFVAETLLMSAPLATRVLRDCVYHSYQRAQPTHEETATTRETTTSLPPDATETPYPLDHQEDGEHAVPQDEVHATSALLLAFDHGRMLICAFNADKNVFVTLSMHAFGRRVDPNDESQYSSLPIRDKLRTTAILELHLSVCSVHGWKLLAQRTAAKQRVAVYGRRYLVALCHNERVVHMVPIVAEFTRPVAAASHQYNPFSEHQESGVRPAEADYHSMVMVPWLRVENVIELNVDAKLGFCDGRYFVRGLDIASDSMLCVLGVLMATKPESVGTHPIEGSDYVIGGMSFVAISVNCATRHCGIVQRMDSLPMSTADVVAIPPSVYGALGFLFRSLDFVMWMTVASPTLCWQFLAPTGLLNASFDDKANQGHDFRFLDAMRLNLDLRNYAVQVAEQLFVLVPLKRGLLYVGLPIADSDGLVRDTLWSPLGELDFEVTALELVTVDGNLELLITGSGVEIARYAVTLPPGLADLALDATEASHDRDPRTVTVPEVPTTVTFRGLRLLEQDPLPVGQGAMELRTLVPNTGAVRDPKNVSLPELWQVGCTRPSNLAPKDPDELLRKDPIIPRFKPQRRPYAVNDRQVIEVATVDYIWPKQQSFVGLCDDSKLVVLMEKYPLHTVISVPLQSGATLVPLEHNSDPPSLEGERRRDSRLLLTWANSTALLTLNEDMLDLKYNGVLDRRPQPKALPDPLELPVATDERTLAYGTACNNSLVLQVTPTTAVFIALPEHTRLSSSSITHFDEGPNSTVQAAEVTNDCLVCLFNSGNLAVLRITGPPDEPALTLARRITAGICLISLYRPRRLNNVFGDVCLLALTFEDTLFCYRLDTFERVFAFRHITQVPACLSDDASARLDSTVTPVTEPVTEPVEEPVEAVKAGGRRTGKRARASAATPSDTGAARTTKSRKGKSRDKTAGTRSRAKKGEEPEPLEQTPEQDEQPAQPGPTTEPDLQDQDTALSDDPEQLRQQGGTLEYVISLRMLDVAPTDLGPTLIVMLTGRPLLVYRSYLAGGAHVFRLLHHRFLQPLPSALAQVSREGVAKQRVFMQLKRDRCQTAACISGPLNLHNPRRLSESDLNHATVSYPHVSPENVTYFTVNSDSTELAASARPLSPAAIAANPDIRGAVEMLQARWRNFRPPCLRLTATGNRLRIHEFELENAIDVETTLGEEEARVGSLLSVVTHNEPFARFVLFVTCPGTLVLCVPGALHQETAINGDVRLQEIVAGSDEPEYLTAKRAPETVWNPLFCRLVADDAHGLAATLSCRRERDHAGGLFFGGAFISHMYPLGPLRGRLTAVSHRNYYLSNGAIRANRNATIATLPAGCPILPVFCGKLVAVVVRAPVHAKEELANVLNERINLQLRQLESEQLPPGTKPIEIIEPNKQICTLIQTLDAIPLDAYAEQPVWREAVLVFHMGDLRWWFGEYQVEPMESVLSLTFGIIGNREYLLLGTCTNLGENVECKGDVVVVDLQPLFQRQPGPAARAAPTAATRSPNCATLPQYCKRIFPGAVSFLTSLNTDFDLIFRPNFNFHEDLAALGKAQSVVIYGNEDVRRWTVSHFAPNFGLFVHSVGPRLFVHEVSGKQFLRGAFAEVPLCVSSACVFDKYIVAGDLNRGLHFFMYRHDAVNDSRTLCKISATVKKVDLSVVACAPLVNSGALALLASDYFANLVLLRSETDPGGRETLVVSAALRLPTRVTHFVRREPDFRQPSASSGALGFCADGSVLLAFMPEEQAFHFFRGVQSALEAALPPPLGVPRDDRPLFTSQMAQTQHVWPGDEAVLYLDLLRQLPFQSAPFLAGEAADAAEAHVELRALLRLVADKVQHRPVVGVVVDDPLRQRRALDRLEVHVVLGVLEVLVAALLVVGQEEHRLLAGLRVLEHHAHHLERLEYEQRLDGAALERGDGLLGAEDVLAGVLRDLLEEAGDEFLLLDELDVAEALGRELDGLLEAVLAAVGDVHDLEHLGRQPRVEHVRAHEVVLEVRAPRQDQPAHVHLVVGDEHEHRVLRHLAHVVVAPLHAQPRETQRGLPTSAVLLRQVHAEGVQNLLRRALQRPVERSVAVHDDEAELVVRLQQLLQRLHVELVVAQVERGVDWLEGLEVQRDSLFLPVVRDDRSAVEHQPVGRRAIVQLQLCAPSARGRLHLLCCVEVMAPSTESRFTRDLMFDAVPYSSASILLILGISSFGLMIRLIILVPFLRNSYASPPAAEAPPRLASLLR